MRLRSSALLARAAHRLAQEIGAVDARRVADEQLREVWSYTRIGVVVASAFAVVMVVYWQGTLPAAVLHGWLAAKLTVTALRLIQAYAFFRQPQAGGAAWRRATLATLALDGLAWGVAGFWLASQSVASFGFAVLAAVSCVATFGLQVSLFATAAYVIPILLPTIAGAVWRADEIGAVGAISLTMLLLLQLATAYRSELRWVEGQLLRLQALQLAHAKDDALAIALRQSGLKSQFFANVSHELRTPLHGILGLARLLRPELADAAQQRRVDLIDASGTHLLGLINDLLDVSRIEAGQFTLRPQPFDLVAQIEHVADVTELRANEQGLVFVRQIVLERPSWVDGDAARFRQVLHNLLGNALKFTGKGGITLSVKRSGDAPDQIVAQVIDTGVGIAPDDLPRLFDAFAQLAPALGAPLAGTGLGLTISREIARAMGGDIGVRSAPGVGSTFTFTARLPACAEVAAGAPVDDARAERAPASAADWRPPPCELLVVEDDDVNALIISAYLERLGLTVLRAHDGVEAVEMALRAPLRPALVLMDCQMPRMDGHVATRRIRAQEAELGVPAVPIIAITASLSEIDVQRCRADGMTDFLGKPFTAESLSQVLRRCLAPRERAEPRAAA
jgi:signal transduction histidine kinase/ActR/RegA family two-component response regulator